MVDSLLHSGKSKWYYLLVYVRGRGSVLPFVFCPDDTWWWAKGR